MRVWIKMTQREDRTAEVLVIIWLSLFLVSAFTPLEWKWFFTYSVIGLIAFIIFGEYKYRKGVVPSFEQLESDINEEMKRYE